MPRPCEYRHTDPAANPSCPVCVWFVRSPAYRAMWDGPGGGAAPPGVTPQPLRSPARVTCRHLGQPTGERRPLLNCLLDPPTTVGLRACAVHGACTEDAVARGSHCCRHCSQHEPAPRPPMEWVSTARLATDAALLAGKLPAGIAGVVGVPRSGLIAASIVA